MKRWTTAASATRLGTSSLANTCRRWVFTVCGDMYKRLATAPFVSPRPPAATPRARSRSDSPVRWPVPRSARGRTHAESSQVHADAASPCIRPCPLVPFERLRQQCGRRAVPRASAQQRRRVLARARVLHKQRRRAGERDRLDHRLDLAVHQSLDPQREATDRRHLRCEWNVCRDDRGHLGGDIPFAERQASRTRPGARQRWRSDFPVPCRIASNGATPGRRPWCRPGPSAPPPRTRGSRRCSSTPRGSASRRSPRPGGRLSQASRPVEMMVR